MQAFGRQPRCSGFFHPPIQICATGVQAAWAALQQGARVRLEKSLAGRSAEDLRDSDVERESGMVFGNIVQVVGYTLSHKKRLVIFQVFKNGRRPFHEGCARFSDFK